MYIYVYTYVYICIHICVHICIHIGRYVFEPQDNGKTSVTYELDLEFGFGLPRMVRNQICGCACSRTNTDIQTHAHARTHSLSHIYTHTLLFPPSHTPTAGSRIAIMRIALN
jgi:hypothetical protein